MSNDSTASIISKAEKCESSEALLLTFPGSPTKVFRSAVAVLSVASNTCFQPDS